MGAPVVHFEVIGKDGKKLHDFYSKLFDWKIDANNPIQYGLVTAEQGGIGGGIGAAQPGQSGYVTFYVQVKDPDEHLKKVTALGGKVVMPTTVIPGMVTFALFSDPEGHMIGLVKEEQQ
ncbi:MAG: glyoxalase [Ignavibacteriales bacterium]|nr:glyoxalase [Ignavibacteriales bacterium]